MTLLEVTPLSLKRSQTRPMRPQYPFTLPKNEEKYREGILDRIEEAGKERNGRSSCLKWSIKYCRRI